MKASGKGKKNVKARQKISADQFLMCIQLYSVIIDAAKQNRRQGGKVNFNIEGVLNETLNLLQERNKEINVQEVFHSWYYLLAWKSLDELKGGQTMVEELQAFDIEIPELLDNCIREIEMRTRFIKEYVSDKHKWTNEKIENRKEEIENSLLAYSYDKESRKQHLKELFAETVKEIKQLESEAISKYGYYIDRFFNAGKFVATEIDLNNFFWHGEIYAGGYTAFHNMALLLIKFVDKHNEVALLKSLINGNLDKKNGTITDGGEDYIKPELLNLLKEIESKLQPKIKDWTKIKVAAWVELLMDRNYFLPEYKRRNNRKNCREFSIERYNRDIKIQLESPKDTDRIKHKKTLLKYFK